MDNITFNNPSSPSSSRVPSSTLTQVNSNTYGNLPLTGVNMSANLCQHNQSLQVINVQPPMTQSLNYSTQETFEKIEYAFFYNPPNDPQIYHIVCSEKPVSFELVSQLLDNIDDNNPTHNYTWSNNYVFYHKQRDVKKVYQVTCELASSQFLNKKVYNIECNQSNQQIQEFSPSHQKNLKSHLKPYLIDYLTSKQDNFDDRIMSGSDQSYTFQNSGENYVQGYENNSGDFQSQQQ
jgi:hypothetical protein